MSNASNTIVIVNAINALAKKSKTSLALLDRIIAQANIRDDYEVQFRNEVRSEKKGLRLPASGGATLVLPWAMAQWIAYGFALDPNPIASEGVPLDSLICIDEGRTLRATTWPVYGPDAVLDTARADQASKTLAIWENPTTYFPNMYDSPDTDSVAVVPKNLFQDRSWFLDNPKYVHFDEYEDDFGMPRSWKTIATAAAVARGFERLATFNADWSEWRERLFGSEYSTDSKFCYAKQSLLASFLHSNEATMEIEMPASAIAVRRV